MLRPRRSSVCGFDAIHAHLINKSRCVRRLEDQEHARHASRRTGRQAGRPLTLLAFPFSIPYRRAADGRTGRTTGEVDSGGKIRRMGAQQSVASGPRTPAHRRSCPRPRLAGYGQEAWGVEPRKPPSRPEGGGGFLVC